MDIYFADTFFYRALLDPTDGAHQQTVDFVKRRRFRTLTTEFVITEIGDGFCSAPVRAAFLVWLDALRRDGTVTIVPASEDLVRAGIEHFRRFSDKDWGLTDCISFTVMASKGIREALTGDRHFEQAGFTALLRNGTGGDQ